MYSLEMWDLCFVLASQAVDDSVICLRSGKMEHTSQVGVKRLCEIERRCRPTSRRMDRSQMDRFVAEVGDKRKRRFYSRANGENDLRIRAELREMRRKCK